MHRLAKLPLQTARPPCVLARDFRVLVALGGNALLTRQQRATHFNQSANIEKAAHLLAQLIVTKSSALDASESDEEPLRVVITHGNGPQVGLLALQNLAFTPVPPYPLDVLGAETEGQIGYLLEQKLRNLLPPQKEVVTMLTQVVVEAEDPEFSQPTKFIGPVYTEAQAQELASTFNWQVRQDGDSWRRVVPSPSPTSIVELSTLRLMMDKEITVVCAGGGGIPVVRVPKGDVQVLQGVEAVIDKDKTSALLADLLDADALVMLTDVECVYENYGMANERPIRHLKSQAVRLCDFPKGSMQPKVEAAMYFVDAAPDRARPRFAAIGSLQQLLDVVRKKAGTIVTS